MNEKMLKNKIHPVVTRIEKFYNSNEKSNFAIVLKKYYPNLSIDRLEHEDKLILENLLNLYPEISYILTNVKFNYSHDTFNGIETLSVDKCDDIYLGNIDNGKKINREYKKITINTFMSKYLFEDECGNTKIENTYNDEYYYYVPEEISSGIICTFDHKSCDNLINEYLLSNCVEQHDYTFENITNKNNTPNNNNVSKNNFDDILNILNNSTLDNDVLNKIKKQIQIIDSNDELSFSDSDSESNSKSDSDSSSKSDEKNY
jgi:hypothetical protein